MKTYVCGFLIDGPGQFVALIKKQRPEWQKGLLNGIGGHIEDYELPDAAMAREFEEEAGVKIKNWRQFAVLEGPGYLVYFFTARQNANLRSMTDEPVAWYNLGVLNDGLCIPNLTWLIPLAMDPNMTKVTASVPEEAA